MKFVLIGKCFSSETNGPGQVMMALKRVLDEKYYERSKVIFWNEQNNKLSFLCSVAKQLFEKDPCLINVHTSGLLIPTLVLLASRFVKRHTYYMTIHGIHAMESTFTGVNRRIAFLEKLLCRTFPNIVCVSQQQREDIKRIYGREKQVWVIPNGTEAVSYKGEKTSVARERTELIALGGLKKCKGIIDTLDLMQYLVGEKKLDVHLTIYGSEEGTQTKQWLTDWCQKNGALPCL